MSKFICLFMISVSIIGCSTYQVVEDKKFHTLSNEKNQISNLPSENNNGELILSNSIDITSKVVSQEYNRIKSFDYLPPEGYKFKEGSITVIFKNNYEIRVDRDNQRIFSKAKTDLSEMEEMLRGFGLKAISDLGNYSKEDDNKLDQMQKEYSESNNVDIPHIRSIHYYKVDKEADTSLLCKQLMKLPYVRLAYPTPTVEISSEYLINSIPYSTLANNTTPDHQTDTNYPSTYMSHYWFHEHEAFRAKNYYKSNIASKPTIAVIDTGFDANSPELNILPGYKITDPWWWFTTVKYGSDCPNNDCINTTTSEYNQKNISHGNAVSYVAAAKNNNNSGNSSSYGEGIAEGANILPFNLVDITSSSITVALSHAQSNSSVDAINISLHINNNPVSFDSAVNTAISRAI
jgi:hypothetical protein